MTGTVVDSYEAKTARVNVNPNPKHTLRVSHTSMELSKRLGIGPEGIGHL